LKYFANSVDEGHTASTQRPNTFSHIGLIVPSLQDAQDRFERHGVNITKRVAVSAEGIASLENAFSIGQMATSNQTERDLLLAGLELTGFTQLLGIQDPDSNFIEVQQLVPPPGVV